MTDQENQEGGRDQSAKHKIKPRASAKRSAQIHSYINDPAKLNRAVASSTTNKRQSPDARAMAKGDTDALKRSIYNIFWNKIPADRRERIAKAICVDWNYCENRDELAQLESIIYIITTWVQPTLIPICVWVYVIRHKMLDELCGCSNRDIPLNFTQWLKKMNKKQ